jgi:hypothetical protein
MTKELRSRKRTRLGGNHVRYQYRYRRYQALNDALDMFFVLSETKTWMSVDDICQELEWDSTDHAVRKRVRRMAEVLVRIDRAEIIRQPFKFMMIRVYKKGNQDGI